MKIIIYSIILAFYLSNSFAQENNPSENDPVFIQFQKGVEAVKNKDYALAADVFEELAITGDMDAQFNYAILVRNGLGRAQNYSEALYWTWLSYAGGLEKADKVLEKILELVPEESHQQIRERVLLFILNKINSGDKSSLLNFGKYYLKILPEEDYNKSYLFYSIAAAFGEEGAKEKRDEILNNVDNEKIIEIQSQASEMFEKLRNGEKIEVLKD
tara:strand:- start:1022 stop:1666 length:645 start_codon:yes stop_codon:yes gene_type:complete